MVAVVGGDIELQMGILKKTCRTDGLVLLNKVTLRNGRMTNLDNMSQSRTGVEVIIRRNTRWRRSSPFLTRNVTS